MKNEVQNGILYPSDFPATQKGSKMKTVISDIYTNQEALREAGRIIREGGLVAFPTETVYGLGGDALNPEASGKIYAAKGRPSDNPLIVHICEIAQVDEIACDISDQARKLMARFMPGPLTVILKKKDCVPKSTTGGLDTVAVRMPSHPVASALIRESGRLIAAPSANLSGRPSPTTAAHVYEDMKGRIPLILDGGNVDIGIESTIVDMTGPQPMILRPGYITPDMIREVLGDVTIDPAVSGKEKPVNIVAKAPGMKYRHYAPKGRLTLLDGAPEKVRAEIVRLSMERLSAKTSVGILCTAEDETFYRTQVPEAVLLTIGHRNQPETVAARLYDTLRKCDELELEAMYCECFFDQGLGDSIMNRLLKAAGYERIEVKDCDD